MTSKEQMQRIIDCVEAQARAAAEKPDAHNLMQLGACINSLRNRIEELYSAPTATDADGWIEWGGGDCPVIPGNRVDLKLRGGVITHDYPAECCNWYHGRNNNQSDIIAYRVVS